MPFRLGIKNSFWSVAADRKKSQDQCELSEPAIHSILVLVHLIVSDSHLELEHAKSVPWLLLNCSAHIMH